MILLIDLFLDFLSILISRHYNILRYPYEAIHVITSDGYVILLERIPRYNSFL